jgi:hypothetical protein
VIVLGISGAALAAESDRDAHVGHHVVVGETEEVTFAGAATGTSVDRRTDAGVLEGAFTLAGFEGMIPLCGVPDRIGKGAR